jgi:hypothetical protein
VLGRFDQVDAEVRAAARRLFFDLLLQGPPADVLAAIRI